MAIIKTDSKGWRIGKNNPRRLKEGVAIMRHALAEDAEKERNRKSRLPPDWRNRIITN